MTSRYKINLSNHVISIVESIDGKDTEIFRTTKDFGDEISIWYNKLHKKNRHINPFQVRTFKEFFGR